MKLTAIDGGLAPTKIGNVTVHVVGDDEPLPVGVDAVVVEEDRWLSLTAPTDVVIDDANPIRTTHKAHDAAALDLGTIVARGALWKAIVIDVDADVACVPSSVQAAVSSALARGPRALRLPLLGTAHGRLTPLESAGAIAAACAAYEGRSVVIVVVASRDVVVDVAQYFRPLT